MRMQSVVLSMFLMAAFPVAADDPPVERTVVLDEDVWVLFYDLPSRRFREIRTNFVKRQFDAAAADLVTSAGYLVVESERAAPDIATRLVEVADRLTRIAGHMQDPAVTGAELDSQFGRAHWLLAQHYLDLAHQLRDLGLYRRSGLHLWATTHHLERAVLWSNARIDRQLLGTLEDLQELAMQMQDEQTVRRAMNDRPIVRAEAFLRELGQSIDRPVADTAR